MVGLSDFSLIPIPSTIEQHKLDPMSFLRVGKGGRVDLKGSGDMRVNVIKISLLKLMYVVRNYIGLVKCQLLALFQDPDPCFSLTCVVIGFPVTRSSAK